MKKLIIADIHSNNVNGICSGHYIPLAKMYCQLFRGKADIRVASGPIYQKDFRAEEMIALPYDMVWNKSYIMNRTKAMLNAYKLFHSNSNCTIVLQDGKPMTNHLGIALFHWRKNKLFLIKYTKNGIQSLIGKLIWKMVKSRVDGVICPNEEIGKAFNRPYCVIPDYIYSGDDNPCPIKYNDKTWDFCMVGRINKDKGVVEIAKKLANTNYKVLIAGKAEADCEEKLKTICKNHANITLRLGYISENEYKNYIQESRYCILNYQGEYSKRSSGVVYDTIFNGVPVIGNRCQALEFIEEYQLGCILGSIDSNKLSRMLDSEIYVQYLRNIYQYRQQHKQHLQKLSTFIGLE